MTCDKALEKKHELKNFKSFTIASKDHTETLYNCKSRKNHIAH